MSSEHFASFTARNSAAQNANCCGKTAAAVVIILAKYGHTGSRSYGKAEPGHDEQTRSGISEYNSNASAKQKHSTYDE